MMPNKLVFLMASFLILTSVTILMTSQGSSGAKRGGDIPACAACKYQRRRCGTNCFFRRYFPADRHEDLQNVRRLFGLCATENKLRLMSPDEQDDAMKSIIYESNMRARFPVYGCSEIICYLRNRIALLNAEILRMKTQIATFTSASDPATAAYNPAAADSSSLALRNPPMNRTLNNNEYFMGVPVVDGTRSFFPGGGYSGNFAYGECVTEARPLEITNNAQQFLPSSNNLGSCSANADNANNYNIQLDGLDFDAALLAFAQIDAQPPNSDNRILSTNDNQIQLHDHLLPDDGFEYDQPSFTQTGDVSEESMKKDDDFPYL